MTDSNKILYITLRELIRYNLLINSYADLTHTTVGIKHNSGVLNHLVVF